jgi:outer membrane immunogenic protein
MKGLWGSSAAALLVAASSGAFAADMAVRPPPPMMMAPPVYNWTGFYVGGNLGGAWESGSLTDSVFGVDFSNSRSGFIGGGQVGYNWQIAPQFVLGVEWMFDGTDLSSNRNAVTVLGGSLSASERVDWITTLAARFGYAAYNWLFYGKVGGAWVHDTATVTDVTAAGNVFSASLSDTKTGWVVGAGIEYGFTPNWTAKLEYDHIGLEDVTRGGVLVNDSITLSRSFDMVTFGMNFKF